MIAFLAERNPRLVSREAAFNICARKSGASRVSVADWRARRKAIPSPVSDSAGSAERLDGNPACSESSYFDAFEMGHRGFFNARGIVLEPVQVKFQRRFKVHRLPALGTKSCERLNKPIAILMYMMVTSAVESCLTEASTPIKGRLWIWANHGVDVLVP